MLKKLLFLSICMLSLTFYASAQEIKVSGSVKDANGEPLLGATITIKGTIKGVVTDNSGNYSILAPKGATLVFSFVGFNKKEVVVGNQTQINVSLSDKVLGEVVVTALGVSREERSLGYSVQQVDAAKLSVVNESNVVGSLSGKISGVQVIGSSGAAIGGSQKIRLRGVTSLGSNDSPLIVVDGTPISNTTFAPSEREWSGGRDYGNLAGDINFNDIASVSVLKGPSAAALYGQRGANGVIIISTKKGNSRKGIGIDFNHSTTFDRIYVLPKYQNEYAGGYSQDFLTFNYDPARHPANWASFDGQKILNYGADESWGPRMDGTLIRHWDSWYPGSEFGQLRPLTSNPNNVRDFFETGTTITNNIALSGGDAKSTFRLSFGNTSTKGVMPNSKLSRTNVGINASTKMSTKLTASVSLNYALTSALGRPSSGYSGRNPVNSFNQWFQRQIDIDRLRNYRNPDGTMRTWNIIGPNDYNPANPNSFLVGQYWNSPYFESMENAPTDNRNRIFGNLNLTYEFMPGLSLSVIGRTDAYSQTIEEKVASGGLDQDMFYTRLSRAREDNYEFLLQYNKRFGEFSLDANLGGNIRRNMYNEVTERTVGGLAIPDLYTISASVDCPNVTNYKSEKEVRSIYMSTSLGYKGMLYMDITARNDWSSSLPEANNSYFYPSVSTSFVFSELLNIPWFSFGKLRVSWAQVGSDIGPYNVNPVYAVGTPYGSSPSLGVPGTLNNPALEPQTSSNYEAGIEAKFLKGRIGFDVTYYYNPIKNQIITLPVPSASGYNNVITNAGQITRSGIEVAISGTPVKAGAFSWDVNLNFARNLTTVDELAEGVDNLLLEQTLSSRWGGTSLFARVGEQWGQVVGRQIKRNENGLPMLTSNGSYVVEQNKPLGSVLPDFTGGIMNTFRYKNWELSAFIDFQIGGKFFSVTKMFNAYSGLSAETVGNNDKGVPLRDALVDAQGGTIDATTNRPYTSLPASNTSSNSGGIKVAGVAEDGTPQEIYVEAQTYYSRLFGLTERWLYDASYVKLRELRLAYTLPKGLIAKTPFNSVSIGFIARNLWLIHTNVEGLDPSEISGGAGGYNLAEGGQLPGVRSLGFNIRLGL